jgi:hypothetical protein
VAPAVAQQGPGTPPSPGATTAADGRYLPPFPPPFKGHIGREAKDSTPDFPKEVRAPKGAPNILLILTDDVGLTSEHDDYELGLYDRLVRMAAGKSTRSI